MQNDLRRLSILSNPILNTDSYKASHYLQYPQGTTAMFSYIESRGGRYDRTLFFGLQMLMKEYLCQPITAAMIDEARDFFAPTGTVQRVWLAPYRFAL
jgi:nicotinamide phosphoribosyltransferase